jgi:hypothetical protein
MQEFIGIRLDEAAGDWWNGMVAEIKPGVFRAFLGKGRSQAEATADAKKDMPAGAVIYTGNEVQRLPKAIKDQLHAEFAKLKTQMSRRERIDVPDLSIRRSTLATEVEAIMQVPEISSTVEQVDLMKGDTFQLGEWMRAYLRRLPITEDNEDLRELAHRPGVNWTQIAQSAIDTRRE